MASRTRPYTTKERRHAVDLYANGMSEREVQEATGVPRTTLRQWRRAAGIPGHTQRRRPERFTAKQKMKVVSMYRAGLSTYVIEREMGISESTQRGWLKSEGVKMRPRGGSRGRVSSDVVIFMKIMYARGFSQKEIGRWTGRHQTTVGGLLRRNGVILRTRSENLQLAHDRGHRKPTA